MPRRIWILYCPNVLEAALSIPWDREAAEAEVRDIAQSGQHHQRGHRGRRHLPTQEVHPWSQWSNPKDYGSCLHWRFPKLLYDESILAWDFGKEMLQRQELRQHLLRARAQYAEPGGHPSVPMPGPLVLLCGMQAMHPERRGLHLQRLTRLLLDGNPWWRAVAVCENYIWRQTGFDWPSGIWKLCWDISTL